MCCIGHGSLRGELTGQGHFEPLSLETRMSIVGRELFPINKDVADLLYYVAFNHGTSIKL